MDATQTIQSLRQLCDAWDEQIARAASLREQVEALESQLAEAHARDLIARQTIEQLQLRIAELEAGDTPQAPQDPPLQPATPALSIEPLADGVRVSWSGVEPAAELRLLPTGDLKRTPIVLAVGGEASRDLLLPEIRQTWPDAAHRWVIQATLHRGGEQIAGPVVAQIPPAPSVPAEPKDPLPPTGEFARPEWSADWMADVAKYQTTDPAYHLVAPPADVIECHSIAELQEACRRHPDKWKLFERWQITRPNIVLDRAQRVIIRRFEALGHAGKRETDAIFRLVDCRDIHIYDGYVEDAWEVVFAYNLESSVIADVRVNGCNEFVHIWHQPGKGRVLQGSVIADNHVTGLLRHGIELQGGRLINDGGNLDPADVMEPQVRDLLVLRNYIDGGDMAMSLATSGGLGGRAIGNKGRKGRPLLELMGEWYLERNHAINRASDCAMIWPELNKLRRLTIGPGNIAERTRPYLDYTAGPGPRIAERVQLAPVMTIDAAGKQTLVSKLW